MALLRLASVCFLLAFAFAPLLCLCGAPSPPLWGGNNPFYTVVVNLTSPQPAANWTFQYYFDGLNNASRYEHSPPQFDEMCADQPYGSEYRCDVLFAADGWSYIIFPTVDPEPVCCMCENSFGSTLWTWLEDNSTFAGIVEIDGVSTQHWTKWGHVLNHYFVTDDDDQAAVRYNELWTPNPGVPPGLKQWDFNTDTLRTGSNAYPASKLAPPTNCPLCVNDMCVAMRINNTKKAETE